MGSRLRHEIGPRNYLCEVAGTGITEYKGKGSVDNACEQRVSNVGGIGGASESRRNAVVVDKILSRKSWWRKWRRCFERDAVWLGRCFFFWPVPLGSFSSGLGGCEDVTKQSALHATSLVCQGLKSVEGWRAEAA